MKFSSALLLALWILPAVPACLITHVPEIGESNMQPVPESRSRTKRSAGTATPAKTGSTGVSSPTEASAWANRISDWIPEDLL